MTLPIRFYHTARAKHYRIFLARALAIPQIQVPLFLRTGFDEMATVAILRAAHILAQYHHLPSLPPKEQDARFEAFLDTERDMAEHEERRDSADAMNVRMMIAILERHRATVIATALRITALKRGRMTRFLAWAHRVSPDMFFRAAVGLPQQTA